MTLERLIIKHKLHNDVIDLIFGTVDKPYCVMVNVADNHVISLSTDINWLEVLPDVDLADMTYDVSLVLKNVYSILRILYPKDSVNYRSRIPKV